MSVDQWTRTIPYTKQELVSLRTQFEEQHGKDEVCTCTTCPRLSICELSYDGYNTNGDCLYDK